jgi:hypothetical protein
MPIEHTLETIIINEPATRHSIDTYSETVQTYYDIFKSPRYLANYNSTKKLLENFKVCFEFQIINS